MIRWLWWVVLGAGCTTAISEEGPTESRPIETFDDGTSLKRGVVQCTPQRVTGYRSGTPSAIVAVQVDGKPVEVATANAYAQMQAAAQADGISLRIVSGFRSQAEQQYLYGCYVNCNCNNCNLAAFPGYSNHQSGLALDLNTVAPGVLRWLNRNAARFGFARTVPSEDWHWEYFGGVDGGPCDPSGAPRAAALAFVGFEAGRRYANGQWLKVESDDAALHHVEYRVDGYPVGVSEDTESGFAVRLVLHTLGRRTVQATGYDARNRRLASTEVTVEFTAGETATPRLAFSGLEAAGWYRNGLRLKVDNPPEGTHAVEYGVGQWSLGKGTPGDGFPRAIALNSLGYRAFWARALDPDGAVLARGSVLIRVLPGDDTRVDPSIEILSPEPDDTRSRAVDIKLAASDRVARIVLDADGWDIGDATLKDGLWHHSYRFNQAGTRRLMATGFDAAGQTITTAEVRFTVR